MKKAQDSFRFAISLRTTEGGGTQKIQGCQSPFLSGPGTTSEGVGVAAEGDERLEQSFR